MDNINIGKISDNDFTESDSVRIAKAELEKNHNIKTYFTENDKTPNFDGNVMILDKQYGRNIVEVQIKALPKIKNEKNGIISFSCDTKAMNCVIKNVTFNPVILLIVDIDANNVYYKLLTKEYIATLKIGKQQSKTIYISDEDIFNDKKFIEDILAEVKITHTNKLCRTECEAIRESIRNAKTLTEENFKLVYERGDIQGFFCSYTYKSASNSFVLCKIQMICDDIIEILAFQCNFDYIEMHRNKKTNSITDADYGNIILEVSKEIKKPIMYTTDGKPSFWFDNNFLWQLRSEEIELDYLMRS